jgi:prepilin-type processing-associated H-X9-DG protein
MDAIQAQISQGVANGDCILAHLSTARSYAYLANVTLTPTQGALMFKAHEESFEGIRNAYGMDLLMDLGPECHYNDVYNQDNGTWTGTFEVPPGSRIEFGVRNGWLTGNGDVDTTTRFQAGDVIEDDGSYAPSTLPRLREGVERFLITDINNPAGAASAQSAVPVMLDGWAYQAKLEDGGDAAPRPETFNHIPGGCNVLYFDGHVSFVRYPTEYPVRIGTRGEGLNFASRLADGLWE